MEVLARVELKMGAIVRCDLRASKDGIRAGLGFTGHSVGFSYLPFKTQLWLASH